MVVAKIYNNKTKEYGLYYFNDNSALYDYIINSNYLSLKWYYAI